MPKLRPAPRPPGLAPEVEEIPMGIRRAAAWSWRMIVVVAASALLIWGLLKVAVLVIPVLIAVLLAALLTPVVKVLTRYTFLGRGAASGIALLGLLLVISGMFTLAGRQLFAQYADIQNKAIAGFQALTDWATATFQIDDTMINSAIEEGLAQLQQNADQLVSGALGTAAVLGNVATGIVICLFALFFFLAGGSGIWRWTVGLLPPAARVPTHEAFRRGWKALSAYIRTQILVAGVDATGIAIGMIALGLGSYAVPIWLLVFLFSFIPLVGAIASGAVAVLLVLVLNGWIGALIMLAIVLAVQQLEGNVLQPFLMGKAVELHPLAVFLGVAAGAMVAGIAGALFAIPLIAFLNATLLYVVGRDPSPELGQDQASAQHFASLGRKGAAAAQGRAEAAAAATAVPSAPRPVPATAGAAASGTAAPVAATPGGAAPSPDDSPSAAPVDPSTGASPADAAPTSEDRPDSAAHEQEPPATPPREGGA
ncbi:AI-2E family transporter [Brachybacterium saurashtrense]|uniref:AI-2E family transporter n=1 Tax=Brachybacterium saurashtrense TaxID=556288 RepID=A0A345YP82_9MICO|nr:AI-2E family transporter [Brachybacterium saurashtrense]AXK45734.1 AI-2E family transporter [Brachybacterium saurashtrense]RRR24752.1 AI-2E family transporter [Brachybacterium saurashtrense]